MDIGPGDWVKCVNVTPKEDGPMLPLTEGSVYFVLAVGKCTHPNFPDIDCVFIKPPNAIIAGLGYCGHDINRFRPFHGPEIEQERWREKKIIEETFSSVPTFQDWDKIFPRL